MLFRALKKDFFNFVENFAVVIRKVILLSIQPKNENYIVIKIEKQVSKCVVTVSGKLCERQCA